MKDKAIVITEEFLMSAVILPDDCGHEYFQKELILQEPINSLGLYNDTEFKYRVKKLKNLFDIYKGAVCRGSACNLNENYEFHLAQGEYCEFIGEFEKALESYQNGILNGFYDPEPWLRRAIIYMIHSQYDNAIREAKKAVDSQDQNDESNEPGIVTLGKYLINLLFFSSVNSKNYQIDDSANKIRLNKIREWFNQI
jgi:tetratricopeptide (TPR) repeat protein